MFHVILYEPEIPPNTGNIIRLCANSGARLHLIEPLGFSLNDAKLRRAGLDYHEIAELKVYPSLDACLEILKPANIYGCSTKGTMCYADVAFKSGDALLFGPETRGLPADIRDRLPPGHLISIPMQAGNRSLNLSNAVAIILYEAWRQVGFS